MKELSHYIFDSAKKYTYRVKIAGELPEGFYDRYKRSLGMFDVAECSKPTRTPIQKDPYGFPGLKNEEVHIFDITLNYPANSGQLLELARQNGINEAKIVIVGKDFNDSMNAEAKALEEVDQKLLDNPEYPAPSKEQKAASDAYADSYKKAASTFANSSNSAKFEIAGKGEPAPKDMGPQGTSGPITGNNKLPSVKGMIGK